MIGKHTHLYAQPIAFLFFCMHCLSSMVSCTAANKIVCMSRRMK
uniref:Uncharacterized protein n=1 Tax=Rhizophora mucronata TaxID=61149 RepID=A0A2P2NW47_RHIMU